MENCYNFAQQAYLLSKIILSCALMKLLLVCLCILALVSSLPYVEQMLLANSMIVGKDDQSDLINWECNVCDKTNRPLHAHYIEEDVKDIKCILSVYPSFVVLAFRYTNTLLNVWQDILYANQVVDTNVCPNCKVQGAYKKMWQSIQINVTRDLRVIQNQTALQRIYLTGISLGGGLAVISYIDIINANIFQEVEVLNYGAPRVANKYYADYFDKMTNKKARRFIVKGDPIVVLPECLTMICSYRHIGNQYVCIEEEAVCRGNMPVPQGFFERLEWTLYSKRLRRRDLGSIIDHIYGYKKIYNYTIVEK